MYHFVRVLNNNAVLAKKSDEQEVILMGKGIGFRCGKGDDSCIILHEDVEKTFIPLSNNLTEEYLDLIRRVDEQILSVCSEIVLKASENLGDLQPNIFILLSVHIDFAVRRIKENIVIENPLMDEIEMLYPTEYAVAMEAKKMLEKQLQMTICDEEAGYIALHLHAARTKQDVKDSLRRTNLLRLLSDKTEELLKIDLKKGFAYRQLMDHLRGVLERVENDISVHHPLLIETRLKLVKEFDMATHLAGILAEGSGKKVSENEIGYIAIHLHRLKKMAL
ncbi:MAG: PRD domain-containing protein [Peptostreptococcaceae bacterium]|nr:PRD domain-containing protein [Peptostreptococcaceae bacterium]